MKDSFDPFFHFAINLFDLLICYRYFGITYSRRKFASIFFFASLMDALLTTYINSLCNYKINFFWAIINVGLISLMFKEKLKEKLIRIFLFIFIGLISEPFTGMILLQITDKNFGDVFINDVSVLTYFGIILNEIFKFIVCGILGIVDKHRRQEYCSLSLKISILFGIVPILSIVIIYYFLRIIFSNAETKNTQSYLICILILMYINILVYYIFELYSRSIKKIIINTLVKQELLYKDQYYKKIEENQIELRKIRHNLKNQQISILETLEGGNVEEAKEAIKSIVGNLIERKNKIYSQNSIIDGILSSKLLAERQYSHRIKVKVNVPEKLNIDILDLGTVLGNLLDNALEAYKDNVQAPFIEIFIGKCKNVLVIEVTNSYSGQKRSIWTTRKADTINHGIGLKSVREIVKKYNGTMKVHAENNVFTASVSLCL